MHAVSHAWHLHDMPTTATTNMKCSWPNVDLMPCGVLLKLGDSSMQAWHLHAEIPHHLKLSKLSTLLNAVYSWPTANMPAM